MARAWNLRFTPLDSSLFGRVSHHSQSRFRVQQFHEAAKTGSGDMLPTSDGASTRRIASRIVALGLFRCPLGSVSECRLYLWYTWTQKRPKIMDPKVSILSFGIVGRCFFALWRSRSILGLAQLAKGHIYSKHLLGPETCCWNRASISPIILIHSKVEGEASVSGSANPSQE